MPEMRRKNRINSFDLTIRILEKIIFDTIKNRENNREDLVRNYYLAA